jgi:Leucine-rich repeat (LRR) protein
MRKLLVTVFVALLMVGCGGEGQNPEDSNADNDSASAPFVDKWAEWEANPEPYGGLEVLAKIKEAKESGATVLHLTGREITDISPLAGLTNLEKLWLGGNQISDISPLAGLTKLGLLELSYNWISDVSPLAGLTKLRELIIDDNEITDVSPLAGLTGLKYLWILDNEITEAQKAMLKKALPNCSIKFD